jgi:excinuclease ABC subunit A
LGGRKQVGMGFKRLVAEQTPRLILEGACGHNLKHISSPYRCSDWCVVTGVSGSGKSTLIQDTLAPALLRHFGKSTDAPAAFERLLGAEQLSDVVFVDQSPIGKTARSNPASFVGAWDSLREIFANATLSRQRGYTASKFSFNSGDGRCPTCGGSGFEHVEMQFLSDIYLRCPDCNGQRFRPEVLEVTIARHSRLLHIADVLDLTVSEAAAVVRARPRGVARPATHHGCGAGLRQTRPAGAHAQRWRGAAAQTGRFSWPRPPKAVASVARRWRGVVCCSCLMSPPRACTLTTSPS